MQQERQYYVGRQATPETVPMFWHFMLIALAVGAFINSFPAAFHIDDFLIVVNNPLVARIDLPEIFSTDYWGVNVDSGLFRPLTILSFGLESILWGLNANTVHAVNLLLHVLVSVLVFLVFKSFDIDRKVSWLAAALFAVHPIHTEVVNMAVGRAELLAALGVLVALWAWQHPRKTIGWPVMAVFCLVGLLSKENAIVLLGWLPVLVFYCDRKVHSDWRKKVVPYALLCAVTLCWLGWRTWGVVRAFPADGYDPVYTPLAFLSPVERILTALKFQWLYLRKLLLPYDLQAIYSGNDFFQPVSGLFSFEGASVALASIFFLAVVVWLLLRRHPLGLGLSLYLIAVTPASNLFFVSGVTFAERLLYLPSIGFCLVLAVALVRLTDSVKLHWQSAAFAACLGVFLVTTLFSNADYSSAQSLLQKDLHRDPQNILAWMLLANSYVSANKPVDAEKAFRKMVLLDPEFSEGLRSYAAFLLSQARYQEAIQVALQVTRDTSNVYPTIYLVLGQAYVAVDDYSNALYWLNQTRGAYEDYGVYWGYRGRVLEGLGDEAGAISSYRRMGKTAKVDFLLRFGTLLLQDGQVVEAREVLLEVVQRDPRLASGWNSLGVSHVYAGDNEAARIAFKMAVQLAPDNLKYQENLDRLLVKE
ncbi:MAG: hypothetical protein C0623_08025 [Desulfuromonas sp.]|nr:MAG: hypothetical protein C0623_08025 [Desulfuromonas sp.]